MINLTYPESGGLIVFLVHSQIVVWSFNLFLKRFDYATIRL